MVLKIVRHPDPVLRAKCRAITEVTPAIRQLAADMIETMRSANGVGLAAPQVAVDQQLAVIDVSHNPQCLTFLRINGERADMVANMPVIFLNPTLELGKDKDVDEEGCLSFPRLRGDIRRSEQVKVTSRRSKARRRPGKWTACWRGPFNMRSITSMASCSSTAFPLSPKSASSASLLGSWRNGKKTIEP